MDRPVKMNPRGKYNLNFIDWTNQWQRIAEIGYHPDRPVDKSPIYGMSVEQEFRQLQYEEELVRKEVYGLGDLVEKVKKVKIEQTQKTCSVCIIDFAKGQVIRMLPCKHIFHQECILPWFQKNSVCPNCKMDIKKHFSKQK